MNISQGELHRGIELKLYRLNPHQVYAYTRMNYYIQIILDSIGFSSFPGLDSQHLMDWIEPASLYNMEWINDVKDKESNSSSYEDGVRNEAIFQRILQSDKYYSDILPHRRSQERRRRKVSILALHTLKHSVHNKLFSALCVLLYVFQCMHAFGRSSIKND